MEHRSNETTPLIMEELPVPVLIWSEYPIISNMVWWASINLCTYIITIPNTNHIGTVWFAFVYYLFVINSVFNDFN